MVISDCTPFPANNITWSFFMAEDLPFCIYTTFSLSVPLLLDTKVGSVTWLLRTELQQSADPCNVLT